MELGVPKTTVFLPSDYNGEAQNFDFIQDDKGVIYVANTVGFLEFNGVSWRSFKPDNDGVPISFAKNSKGKIFTGGTGLIGYLDVNKKGKTFFVSLKKKLPKDFYIGFVWNVLCVEDVIYFQNERNLIVYNKGKITIVNSAEAIHWLFESNNTVYVDTKKGLYELKNNQLVYVKGTEELGGPNVRGLIKSKTSTIALTRNNGLFSIKEDRFTVLNNSLSEFLKEKIFTNITSLNDSNFTISTHKGGVLIVDKLLNPIYRISNKGGLTDNNVKKVKQDYHNNLWIGTNRGVTKIKYPITSTFFKHNTSELGTIEKITSYKNTIYLGTNSGTFKLHTISKNQLLKNNHYPEFRHLPKDEINNFTALVYEDKLFFGGQDKIQSYDGKNVKLIYNLNSRKFYKSIHYPKVLYVGHSSGCEILFFNDNTIKAIKINEVDTEIRGIAEDSNKNLWLTTVSDGVYKISFNNEFENQKTTHFGLKDGLPSLRDNLVYNINDDDLIFTTHKGLYKFDESSGKFTPETRFGEKYAGGKEEFIYAFNFDKNENAWMHSFRKKVATVAIKDTLGSYILYEKPLQDIGKMQVYSILSQPDKNVVWFGGSDGLARFDISKAEIKKDTLFYAVISKVIGSNDSLLIEGHRFDKNLKTTLSASDRDIRFEVGATDFTNLKEIKYQYFLEGYDKKWSDWSNEAFKIYTNLNYGNYTFNVRAKNGFENVSILDNYSFSILPFWYQKKMFNAVFILLIIGFISYVANYFSKRKFVKEIHELELVQKYEQEKTQAIIKEQERGMQAMIEAQESERSRIARELHDGVVQQIGSVILKSRNLFSKKNLLEEKESKELLENLENSNQDLRTISHQMMPRALKELGVISALNDLLENSLAYTNIKYSFEYFNIKERLPQKIEITIYRITQELVNNIIKHSKATEVSLQLFNSNDTIILIIEDNGVGISSKKSRKGIGLLNISSRLDMVKGNVNFEPSPKSGTLVTIKIPL